MVVMQTKGSSKLSPKERKELILELCHALVSLKTSEEVADALIDLFTPKEIETIAKRLKIAEYLVAGKQYDYIRQILKSGYSTIARVNTWLNLSGAGFKLMLSRKKKSSNKVSLDEKYDPYSWHNIKRRYSLNFWPQLLLEEIIIHSNKKEKEKIKTILTKMEIKKHQFTRRENKQTYDLFRSKILKKE